MGQMEKLCGHLKGRNLETEEKVRDYLRTRVKLEDAELVNKIVDNLVAENNITPSAKEKEEAFFIPTYKKAIAQFFKAGRAPMTETTMWMEMAFKLDWFRPEDARTFIGFCLRDGLLEKHDDGKLYPAFDVQSVELPLDWSLHDELNIKTGREIVEEQHEEKLHNQAVALANEDSLVQLAKVLAEDGMYVESIADGNDDMEGMEEIMTTSNRMNDKLRVVKKLVGAGMPGKVANGAFDYYELNVGITNEDAFLVAMAQSEKFKDEVKIKKAFDILSKEGCFGFEI